MQQLTDFVLNINPARVKEKLISFIKKTTYDKEASGLLLIFSGQIDSYTVAKLSIEAVGLDSIKLIILSDVAASRRKEILSSAHSYLKIPSNKVLTVDMDKVIAGVDSVKELLPKQIKGIPSFYLRNMGNLLLQTQIVQETIKEKTYEMVGKPKSERERFIQEIVAKSKLRKRLKTSLAYLAAERENFLLVSKTNRTERLTGLFVEFGYGHAADIMPLGGLYRTQVLQLAEFLEIPQSILGLAYSDILPKIKNKYKFFFSLESREVDNILVRLQAGWSPSKTAEDLGLDLGKTEKVNQFFQASKHQRAVPLFQSID